MSKIISVVNQKGGVGKTTTSVNLSTALALKSKKVLLIDLDPQANSTSALSLLNEKTTYDVFSGKISIKEAIQKTATPKLFVLSSSKELAAAELELVAQEEREFFLKKEIMKIKESFDYIFIDCPPSLSLLTVNALVASEEFLVPMQSEYFALEGLSALLDTATRVKKNFNEQLVLKGILLTMFDVRNKLSHQVAKELQKHFGEKVFHTIVPRNVRLSEAPSHGQPIFQYDSQSKGAKAYECLSGEILKKEAFVLREAAGG